MPSDVKQVNERDSRIVRQRQDKGGGLFPTTRSHCVLMVQWRAETPKIPPHHLLLYFCPYAFNAALHNPATLRPRRAK